MPKPRMLFENFHPRWPLLAAAALLCPQPGAPAKPAAKSTAKSTAKAPARAVPVRALPAAPAEYLINPEDVIEVQVRNHTDLNRVVTVRPDGKISFPRAGEVQAAGRAPSALAHDLRVALERTLNNVEVEVEVKEAKPRAREVRVIGAVKAPLSYKMGANWRALDAIAAAGGLSAKPERVTGRVVRPGGVQPFDVALAFAQPGSAANIALQPDDLIVLDESRVPNQVTVTGQVQKPGAYELSDGLSLSSLLAQAGGVAPGAALRQAQVLRRGVPMPLDLSGLDTPAGLSPAAASFRFEIGDVLVLPENQARYGVMGQVARPAYYPLPERAGAATLLKVLAGAGGLTPEADGRAATITRLKDGQNTTVSVDLEAISRGEAPDTVSLQADDVLFVPRKTAQVRALGQMSRPGSFPLTEKMSLMDLVSEAGVPSTGTALSRAYVLREGKQIPVDLYSVLVQGRSNEAVSGFRLQRDDVLIIPNITSQVNVIGMVAKPGAYDLDDTLSLPSLIVQAGSTTPGAALSKAYVLREGHRLPLDLQRLLVTGQADQATANFRFQAGDVLFVPQNQARFGVIGQVVRPGYYPFPDSPADATVFKALAQAGGPSGAGEGGADLSKAHIIRTVNGQQTAIPIDLQSMVQAGGAASAPLRGTTLQPEDVLYIPSRRRGFKLTDALDFLSPLAILRR